MFWKYNQPSNIESILDKDNFTLEDLLNEEDVIQECKTLNGKLIDFLSQKEQIQGLIRYLNEQPRNAEDQNKFYKYCFLSCEIFCCDVDKIYSKLVTDDELLGQLFSILDNEPPLNPYNAGYFGRVVCTILGKKQSELLEYFKQHKNIVVQIITHLDTGAMQDVLLRIIECEDMGGNYTGNQYGQEMVKWLSEVGLCDMLQEQVFVSERPELQQSASEVISAIARSHQYPLLDKISQKPFLDTLTNYALSPDGEIMLIPILKIYINLLMHIPIVQQGINKPSSSDGGQAVSTEQRDIYIDKAVATLTEYTHKFVDLLSMGQSEAQDTPYGRLDPPFGSKRLKVVDYLAALVCTGLEVAKLSVLDAHAIQVCLMYFTKYPYNNLLHHLTTQMLLKIIEDRDPALIKFLFEEYDLLNWIIKAPKYVSDEETFVQHNNRDIKQVAGYHGHLTKLSNCIMQVAEQIETIRQKTENNQNWQTFFKEDIEERNNQENTNNWGVGRPKVVKDLNIKGTDVGFISQLNEQQDITGLSEDLKDLDLGSNLDQQLFYIPQRDSQEQQQYSDAFQSLQKDQDTEGQDDENQFDDNFGDNANWANFDNNEFAQSGRDEQGDQLQEENLQNESSTQPDSSQPDVKLAKKNDFEEDNQEIMYKEVDQPTLEYDQQDSYMDDTQPQSQPPQKQENETLTDNSINHSQEQEDQVDKTYDDNNYWKDDYHKYVTVPDE